MVVLDDFSGRVGKYKRIVYVRCVLLSAKIIIKNRSQIKIYFGSESSSDEEIKVHAVKAKKRD